jgi:hypothetical protein
MSKNALELYGTSPEMQSLISGNRPFDQYMNNRVNGILEAQKTSDELMKDVNRLFLEDTQNKHNFEN